MITIELSDLNNGFQRSIFGLLTAAAVSVSYERGDYLRILRTCFYMKTVRLNGTCTCVLKVRVSV